MNLTYAKKPNPETGGMKLPDRYNEYVIKVDGEIVGSIKWTYYPKNAGGSAWTANFKIDQDGFANYTVINKDFKKLLLELRPRIESVVADWEKNGPAVIARRARVRAEIADLMATGLSQAAAERKWQELESIRIYAEIDAAEIAQ